MYGNWLNWELQEPCYEYCKVLDWVESWEVFDVRIVWCLIELRAISSWLEKKCGVWLSWDLWGVCSGET